MSMTPSQFHAAVQSGIFVLQNGYYVYQGKDADASLYLTKAEGDALLSRYVNGAKQKVASTLANADTGPIKTGLFGVVSKYVEKIGEPGASKSPLEDYEIFQSVDPTSRYGQNIVARKIKAHHWARTHKKELSEEQKSDAALLANTAVDEVDYAGPKLLTEILRTADKETREAVLVFSTAVLNGELSGQVNTVSKEGKGAWAQVTYQFLKSESQTVDPKVAESSYRAVVVYYTEHPQIAEEQGIDLKELLAHPLAKASSSDSSLVDNASSTMGQASVIGDPAPLVDPVVLTTATLKQQNEERVRAGDTIVKTSSMVSAAESDDTAPFRLENEVISPVPLARETIPLPLFISTQHVSDQVRIESQEGARIGSLLPLIEGLSIFSPMESVSEDPSSRAGLNSGGSVLGPHFVPYGDLQQYSARVVHPAPLEQTVTADDGPANRAEAMRSSRADGFDMMAVLKGAVAAFVAPSDRSDATTTSQYLADNPVLTGLAGAQAVWASLAQYGRGPVVLAQGSTSSQSHGPIEKPGQQPNSGDHQGNNREDHQDGRRQPWYEPREESEHSAEAA